MCFLCKCPFVLAVFIEKSTVSATGEQCYFRHILSAQICHGLFLGTHSIKCNSVFQMEEHSVSPHLFRTFLNTFQRFSPWKSYPSFVLFLSNFYVDSTGSDILKSLHSTIIYKQKSTYIISECSSLDFHKMNKPT